MEKPIEQLLVAQEQRIQFMWKSEYHMEVGGIYDFRPAFVHPELLIHSLAAGTVTVAAGIVVEFGMSAIGTDADRAAQCAGLTPKDGHGSLFLDVGRRINGTVFLPSKLENLLDLLCAIDTSHLIKRIYNIRKTGGRQMDVEHGRFQGFMA